MKQEEIFHTPQVLLLGNGLNRCCGGDDWETVIRSFWQNQRIAPEQTGSIPIPLQAVVGTNDTLDTTLRSRPDFLYGLSCMDKVRAPMEKIMSIPFDHILTTNYSYEIERIADPRVDFHGAYCKKLIAHTEGCKRAEPKYLLHTYNQVFYHGYAHKVWHIHGEARKPDSVVLGHYYYGKLLGKYISELDIRGNAQQKHQKKGEPVEMKSWLDAFILGDVYVLGFGYDFSEMDLWWLLNRKKREKAKHGKTVFYEPSHGHETKFALLEAYGADVESLGYKTKSPNYTAFYGDAISDIAGSVNRKKEN